MCTSIVRGLAPSLLDAEGPDAESFSDLTVNDYL
jgi:hypothetical protein